MSNLQLRVISGVVLAVLVGGLTIAGGALFSALMTVIAVLILYEWLSMAEPGGDDRLFLAGAGALVAIGILTMLLQGAPMVVASALVFAVGIWYYVNSGVGRTGLAGLAYSALTLLSMTHLRGDSGFIPGLLALLFLYVTVWTTDIAAYFTGRSLGGPKLAPRISPGKTVSGALGGLAFAVLAASVFAWFTGLQHIGILAVLAALVSMASQIGDLFESGLKRRSGTKDSSQLIPGHGGVMDRMDGLVFGAILLWIACIAIAGFRLPALAYFS